MKYNKTRKISPKYKQYLVLFFLLFFLCKQKFGNCNSDSCTVDIEPVNSVWVLGDTGHTPVASALCELAKLLLML